MSHGSKQKKPHKQEREEYIQPQIVPQIIQIPRQLTSRNVGIATFSNLSKQAEALLNGDNSVVFNNYTNNLIFRSNKLDVKECLNLNCCKKGKI